MCPILPTPARSRRAPEVQLVHKRSVSRTATVGRTPRISRFRESLAPAVPKGSALNIFRLGVSPRLGETGAGKWATHALKHEAQDQALYKAAVRIRRKKRWHHLVIRAHGGARSAPRCRSRYTGPKSPRRISKSVVERGGVVYAQGGGGHRLEEKRSCHPWGEWLKESFPDWS